MNKPLRKYVQTEKKLDIRVKDRGDLKTSVAKTNQRFKKDENNKTEIAFPDGDSRKVSANERQERPKLNIVMKLPTKEEPKIVTEDVKPIEKVGPDRKVIAKEAEKKAVMELKRIREKYAVKVKSPSIPTSQMKKEDIGKLASVKSEMKNSSPEPITITKPQEMSHATENDASPKHATTDKENKELPGIKRKPFIKTVVGKNGSLPIYKAVTFVEQKRKRTILDINIPNPATVHSKQTMNASKYTDTSSLGPVSVSTSIKEKPARKKSARKRDFKRSRRNEFPAAIRDIRDNRSPSTEVAKWAPSSVNQQTQPYYEAWVNTRLAAISKYGKNDKSYLNDEAFLKSFKKALERPTTPELCYLNFADERYTGRIKIKQRS